LLPGCGRSAEEEKVPSRGPPREIITTPGNKIQALLLLPGNISNAIYS